MKINTYAKINLNLKISKDIEDGLHNISSLIVPIDLYDSIEIKETNADVDKIQFDKEGISEENTISKSLNLLRSCLLYTSPSPRDKRQSRMPSSA